MALPDGTFGHRFDDPSAAHGNPPERRFRSIYMGTTEQACFGECLAHFRVSIELLARLEAIDDEEPLEVAFAGSVDFSDDPPRGIVPISWRTNRRVVRATIHPTLRFVNVSTRPSHQYLRVALASVAAALGVTDIDFSTIQNPLLRTLTQSCARHIYDLREPDESPSFAGIRYVSRLDALAWECWAAFDDRFAGAHLPGFPEVIMPDRPALLEIARAFHLSIETLPGRYLRP